MADATQHNPGSGDTASITAFGAASAACAAELGEFRVKLLAAAGSATATTVATSVSAWSQGAFSLTPDLDATISELNDRKVAADEYVAAVEDIRSRASQLNTEKAELARALYYWQNTALEYQNSVDGQARLSEIMSGQRNIEAGLEALLAERHDVDATFTAALESTRTIRGLNFASVATIGSSWSVGRGWDVLNRSIEVQQAVQATERVVQNPGDEDAVIALESELADLGEDKSMWDRYYRENGGVDGETLALALVSLSNVWAHGDSRASTELVDATVASGQNLREGLAIATGNWSTQRSRNFAQELFALIRSEQISPSTVAFLFQDRVRALQGEEFTVAVADEVDLLERMHGGWAGSSKHNIGDPMFKFGGYASREGSYQAASTDLAGQVFLSLSDYPDSALAWLTAPGDHLLEREGMAQPFEDPGDRIAFWYGDRDWWLDGYGAPAQLLAGMQRAEGGIAHEDFDLTDVSATQMEVIAQQTDVLGRAFEQIAFGGPLGGGWDRGVVSDEASSAIVQTIEQQSVQFSVSTIATVDGAGIKQNGYIQIFGQDDIVLPHMDVPSETLTQVVSRLSTDGAEPQLGAFAATFSEELATLVDAGEINPEVALDYVYDIAAFTDGTIDGLQMLDGREDDAAKSNVLGTARFLTDVAVDHTLKKIPVTTGAGVAIGTASEYLFDIVGDAWVTGEAEATERAHADTAHETHSRTGHEALMASYGGDFTKWLGTEYLETDGTPDASAIDAHLRSHAGNAAAEYRTDREEWARYVSGGDK
ncbi:hypothetical protein [Demequina sediminicola]|uniref:hypothetical protein n=1 Tax=Demequina sediminicola TaxID=1095026 RepID=UPI0007826B1A|nr:hypothetical protein [Demequina sediminicola]